ncbi:MAG: MOSC N-terminal beta barrel domain-containing protein [Marmoricola sp.]
MTRLSTTPVKGLALHHPRSISLNAQGADADRLFYLLDESGMIQSCTRNPQLYGLSASYDTESRRLEVSRGDELLIGGTAERGERVETDVWGLRMLSSDVVADPTWSEFFSTLTGRRVQLVQGRGTAYDVRPVTLLGASSVAALAQNAGVPQIDARRFRMLIEFSGGLPYVEDSWEGRLVQVGEAVLRGGGPVHRCAATTRDPETGAVNLQVLRMILDHRGRQDSLLGPGANFGVYGDVVEPGRVSIGDRLEIEPAVPDRA